MRIMRISLKYHQRLERQSKSSKPRNPLDKAGKKSTNAALVKISLCWRVKAEGEDSLLYGKERVEVQHPFFCWFGEKASPDGQEEFGVGRESLS